jgi:putative tryptophan/tyrosine transport system substrate-binding protein
MRRREFIAGLGGAAAWPVVARAQQPTMPVIGFLESRSPDVIAERLRTFRQGLKANGYEEGENVTITYRWAENHDRLPELAAELVRRRVAVIVASGGVPVVFAAKAASATIPIVFLTPEDPVRLGLVVSLARTSSNLTGINFLNAELAAKQLEFLRELVPGATRVALFVNPTNPTTTETTLRDAEPAAHTIGVQIQVLRVSTSQQINTAFATFARERPDAVFVNQDAFFPSRRVQLVQLAAHHRVPAIYSGREYPEIGGLMSYGADIIDAFRQVGVYAGRILKGAKPEDLPVVQSTKVELVINLQTARMLGITVPETLLAAADEVIE